MTLQNIIDRLQAGEKLQAPYSKNGVGNYQFENGDAVSKQTLDTLNQKDLIHIHHAQDWSKLIVFTIPCSRCGIAK